jgi:hypothetical protein
MSLKKFDLAKNLGLKITGQMKAAGVPNRFGGGAAPVLDKREQRKLDAAAGLVPFACKLPMALNKQLIEQAAAHEGGLNGLMAELLTRALSAPAPEAAAETTAPARKAARKKAAPKAQPEASAE